MATTLKATVFHAAAGTIKDFAEITVYRTFLNNGRIGYGLGVYALAGVPEAAWNLMQKYEQYVEEFGKSRLIGIAKDLVALLEKQFGMKFDNGERAMERRQWLFAVCPKTKARLAAKGWK